MISTTKSRSFLLLASLLLALPLPALAAVQITEIMYDAPGADQGHEWVELTNTGSTEVNLAGWKFFEGGTNHGLTAAEGTTTLPAGGIAIISNNPADFEEDFPNYTGAVFKSSFSLKNAGETVSLKDSKLTVIDSATYDSSMDAAGDGNTLHLISSGFVAGAPDPGVYSSVPPKPIEKPAAAAAPAKTSSTKSKSSKSVIPSSTQDSGTVYQAMQELPAAPQAPWLGWAVGLGSLALIAIAGLIYTRLQAPKLAETSSAADEFEIEG